MVFKAPSALGVARHWVVHKNKQPFGKVGAKGWDEAHYWYSLDEAKKVFKSGDYDGLGFIVARESGRGDRQILGGDLDNCRDPVTGEGSAWALKILEKLNTCSAPSLSGTGYRFFCLGKLPGDLNKVAGNGPDDLSEETKERIMQAKPGVRAKLEKYGPSETWNGFEIYEDGPRHLTITGQWLEEYPAELQCRQGEVLEVIENFLPEDAETNESVEVNNLPRPSTDTNGDSSGCRFPALHVTQVIDTSRFEQSGDELIGPNPVTGSTTGTNLKVNVSKDTWCNFHAGIEKGGDAWVWLACESGAIRWDQAGKGVFKDPEVVSRTLEHALKRGLITEEEARAGPKIRLSSRPDEISEDEIKAYKMPEGPKFDCQLPKDHFIQRFMEYGSEISDAYPDYWFAGGLFALAVVADKKIKVEMKQDIQYPNLYIFINGKSSLSRKSTVVNKTESTLCWVIPSLLSALVPTEFSPEAFIEHMSNFNHAPWIRDEAAGVLSLMKKDYMRGFKDTLMQLYDSKPITRMLRTSQRKNSKTTFNVADPYLNVLFATTDASLGANTELNDTLSGFLARFLFFFPQGKKPGWMPLEEGTAQHSMFEDVVRFQLLGISEELKGIECTALHFSPEAKAYYNEWQRIREAEWTASNDGLCMQIYSRLNPTVTKLGMLFELGSPNFSPSGTIRLEFIQEACRLVDAYFMPTARAVYDLVGANVEKNVIDRVTSYLKNHGGVATAREIMREVKVKKADFDEYLDTMVESGVIEVKTKKAEGKTGGRSSLLVFLLYQPSFGANVANVANVPIVPIVTKIPTGFNERISETIETLETNATIATLAQNETDEALVNDKPKIAAKARIDTTRRDPIKTRILKEYPSQISEGGSWVDHVYHAGEEATFERWRAEDLVKRGVVELLEASR